MASSIVVGTLRALLTADTADYEAGMRKAVKTSQDSESKIVSSMKSLGKVMAGAFTVTAIIGAGKAVLDFAGQLTDLAAKTGISTTGLQKLNLAFEQSGVSLESVTRASSELGARLASGDKSAVKAIEKLGLNLNELLLMKPEDQFIAVADAVGNVQNKGEQLAVSKTLFGKGGIELLAGLTGQLKATTDEFENMGLIIDEKTVKSADDFGDKLGLMGKQLLGIVANIVGPLLPALSGLASLLGVIAKVVGDVIGFLVKMATTLVVGVYGGIMKMLSGLAEAATKIPIVGKHLGFMGDASEWLAKQSQDAFTHVKSLYGATDEMGKSASAAAPPVLDLADNTEKSAKAAEKAGQAYRKLMSDTMNETGLAQMAAYAQHLKDQAQAWKDVDDAISAALIPINGAAVDLMSMQIELQRLEKTALPGFTVAMQEATVEPPKLAGAFSSMIGGMKTSLKSLMDGLTGKNGMEGFFNNLGKGIVDGFGNILSGGLASVINMGVQLAVAGVAKIAKIIGGLFESEESKSVNKPRDQFFAQYGGFQGLADKLGTKVTGDVAERLIAAVFAAKTVAAFKAAQKPIVDLIGGQMFRGGTPGLEFMDFGLGSMAMLHGREAVVPEHRRAEAVAQWGGGGDYLAILDRFERGHADVLRELRAMPERFRTALLTRA